MSLRLCAALAAASVLPATAEAGIKVADAVAAAKTLAGSHAGSVQLKTDSKGRPFIAGMLPAGFKYGAYFYACGAGNAECEGMSLVSGFLDTRMTVADMNAWNQQRLPQGFIDSENDPVVQLFTHSSGAYGATSLSGLLGFWNSEVLRFRDYVYASGTTQSISAWSGDASGVTLDKTPAVPLATPTSLDKSLKNPR